MALQTPVTILLVEDSPEDRAIYRRFLSRQTAVAYTCIEAATGADGLRLCQTAQPDCIVLDFSLPDMTGIEAKPSSPRPDDDVPGIRTSLLYHAVVGVWAHHCGDCL
jgi:response regulator RpfG family c-di-GMP phosphodiesterase